MALELLAKEYEQEDSQTMTTALFSDNGSEGSTEDTFIEDTVIQNNDTYIDKIISPTFSNPRINSINSGRNIISAKSPSMYSLPNGKPMLPEQASHDFLMIVESLHDQLNQKDSALKKVAKQLKAKSRSHDDLIDQNNELQHQIQKLRQKSTASDEQTESQTSQLVEQSQQIMEQKEKIHELEHKIDEKDITIRQLSVEIESYQQVTDWLEMQMTWLDSSKSQTKHKLSIQMLEHWKQSILANQQRKEQDTQSTDNQNENTALLANSDSDHSDISNTNHTEKTVISKTKSKKRTKKKNNSIYTQINREIETNNTNNGWQCFSWFNQ